MALTLPGEVAWVLGLLDYDWPEADEDALHQCANAWREFAGQVSTTHVRGTTAANHVVSANSGTAVEKFTESWGRFSGASENYLGDARTAAEALALAFDAAALAVLAGKIAIITQLFILAAEIIAAQAAAPFTFGLSELGALGATQATRVIVRRLLDTIKREVIEAATKAAQDVTMDAVKKMAKDYVRTTVKEVVVDAAKERAQEALVQEAKDGAAAVVTETAQDVVQQGVEAHFDARDGIDLDQTRKVATDRFEEQAGEYVDGVGEGAREYAEGVRDLASPQAHVDRGVAAAQAEAERRQEAGAERVRQGLDSAAGRPSGDGAASPVEEEVRAAFG